MRISKKILAAVLAALMVIAAMPFTALAGTEGTDLAVDIPAQYSQYGDVVLNGTYYLSEDVTTPSQIYVTGTTVIDFNGHTLTSTYPTNAGVLVTEGSLTLKGTGKFVNNSLAEPSRIFINMYTNSSLAIQDNVSVESNGCTVSITPAKNKTAENITINVEGGAVKSSANSALSVNGNVATTSNTINISGGTVESSDGIAIYAAGYADWNITGGTVTGATAIYAKSGDITISDDAYLVATGGTADYEYSGDGATATGAAIVADSCNYPGGAPTVTVSGGTVESYAGNAVDTFVSTTASEPATVNVDTEEATIVEHNYVAKVGSTYYATLDAAVSAAQAGDTITLIDNVVVSSPIVVAAEKNIKLDLNGKSISGYVTEAQGKKLIQVSGELEFVGTKGGCIYGTNTSGQGYAACQALTGGKITVNSPIHFGDSDTDMTNANTVNRGCGIQNNGGTLIINDGYYTAIDSDYVSKPNKYAYAILNCSGDTIVNNATVYGEPNGNLGCEAGTLTVNGGTYEVKSANYYSLYAFGGVTTVNGGTFVNNGQYGVNYLGTGAETVIKGGTFTYTAPFNNSGSKGNPVVSGGTFSNEVAAKYIEENYECVGPTEGWYTIVPAAVDTMSITIEDNIDINIYLDDSTASEEYFKIDRVEYTYNSTPDLEQNTPETVSAPATRNADGKVVLNIELAPGQIRDVISIVAYSESNTKVRDFETSIAEYCEAIIEGNYPSDLKDLAKSTLDYGKGASRYFGYNTEAYNNYSIQLDDPTDQINAIAQAAANNTIDTSKFTITGVSYRATSKPEIRFYIDPESTSEDELAGYNRTVVSTIGTAYFAKHDDDYLLIVKDIDITDFNKQFVVTVKDSIDPSNDWDVVHFTPITWVKAAIGSEDENLAFFAKTIGNYYLKSVNYFGA